MTIDAAANATPQPQREKQARKRPAASSKSAKRDSATGTPRGSNPRQMLAVFEFDGLPELGAPLEGLTGTSTGAGKRRGRRSPYPPLSLFAVMICSRAAGSLAQALQTFWDNPDLWKRCAAAYERTTGVSLPPVPPTREQVRYLRDQIIKDRAVLTALQHTFRRVAVGQARVMGNLLPGVEPDWANPDEKHAIYGDGTNIRKYSDVRRIVHPATGEVEYIGSRAKNGAPRVQYIGTDFSDDEKDLDGLNMVSVHTWTEADRIVLGTGVALGAELWAALEIIEHVKHLAGDGVHTLIYDRAITGQHVNDLMAEHRIQVLAKAVGGNNERSVWDTKAMVRDVQNTVERRIAEYGAPSTPDLRHLFRRDVLADMLRYHERLPLGLSIYPNDKRNFDSARSFARELESFTHEVEGSQCVHRLAMDDGGLFEITDGEEGLGPVKVRVIRCESSRPVQRKNGLWGTHNEYTIPCEHGDITYTRLWEPVSTRHAENTGTKLPADPIGWRLRPLSRADDIAAWYNDPDDKVDHFATPRPFSESFSRRNDAESYNQWYQQSLPHHGRAASPTQEAQEFDFLLAAMLNNARAWRRFRQAH